MIHMLHLIPTSDQPKKPPVASGLPGQRLCQGQGRWWNWRRPREKERLFVYIYILDILHSIYHIYMYIYVQCVF